MMNREEKRAGRKVAMVEMKRAVNACVWDALTEIEGAANYPSAPLGLVRAWRNSIYSVQEYQHRTDWGMVTNLMVRRHDAAPVRSWKDMQRIKDELMGENREAVEVYPARRNVVDDANLYHLWVLPAGFSLPFGLHTSGQTKIK